MLSAGQSQDRVAGNWCRMVLDLPSVDGRSDRAADCCRCSGQGRCPQRNQELMISWWYELSFLTSLLKTEMIP